MLQRGTLKAASTRCEEADPEEIAPIVVFLASEHGRYITGATINVTGGQLLY